MSAKTSANTGKPQRLRRNGYAVARWLQFWCENNKYKGENMNDKCKELIFTALGSASMCWNPRPGNQVFDSSECSSIGEKLINDLDDEINAHQNNSQQINNASKASID